MPTINVLERENADGSYTTEYIDSVSSAATTFNFTGKQHDIQLENLGDKTIIVTIPPYIRYRVRPGKTTRFEKVSADSMLLRAESGVQGFRVTATRFGPMRYKVEPPSLSDFNYPSLPITVYTDGNGHYDTDFDVASKFPTGKEYFVDLVNGLDTKDGLTPATAFKTMTKAASMADIVVMTVMEGTYDRPNAFANAAVTKSGSLFIRAYPGHTVRIVNCSPQTWVRHGTYTNLFSTAASPIAGIYDDKYPDDNGDMYQYTPVSTAQEANSRPGTYWISAGTVFVNPVDSRTPDASIMVMKDQLSAQFNDGTFSFENISFEGGNVGAVRIEKVAAAPKAYIKNCQFKYSVNDATSWGGLTVQGASEVISQGCNFAKNYNDGANYHVKSGTIPNAIEINCLGPDNGVVSDTDNGSTMHDGGKIVRLNCKYPRNRGSNVGDINPGTESWNIGCIGEDSKALDQIRYNSNFTAHDGAKVILEGCESRGSANDYTVQNNAVIMFRGFKSSNSGRTFEGTGKIWNY